MWQEIPAEWLTEQAGPSTSGSKPELDKDPMAIVFGDEDSELTDLSDDDDERQTRKPDLETEEDSNEDEETEDEEDDAFPDYGVAEDERIRREGDTHFDEWETVSTFPQFFSTLT